MSNRNCDITRREIDEVGLGDELSITASKHLGECLECQDFRSKQTKLREIVGSLKTVSAPPDFDFKLRARLASGEPGYQMRSGYWPLASRLLATFAVIIVVVAAVIGVRQLLTNKPPAVTAERQIPAQSPIKEQVTPPQTVQPGVELQNSSNQKNLAVNSPNGEKGIVIRSGNTERKAKRIVSTDFSNEGATVIKGNSPQNGTAIPITATAQSFTVSLEDSRGNARTISVPTVSFGSQRLLSPANQFVPKGTSW